jgi:hypothetical protein
MKAERPKVEGLLVEICRQHGFKIKLEPGQHAGGKYKLGYDSALGSTQNLQVGDRRGHCEVITNSFRCHWVPGAGYN